MFFRFFYELREAGLPVSLKEFLMLLEGLEKQAVSPDAEAFYLFARAALIKDEKYIDRFDRVFSSVFKGLSAEEGTEAVTLPEEWLRKMAERLFTEEEMKAVEALGGFDRLMATLRERLKEQEGRHQGGSKWIGTAGTSPFGAYGYNPEGVRIGQSEGRHGRAVKVWDRRDFKNFDIEDEVIDSRSIQVALRRLRKFARTGVQEELDLPGTISATAKNGGHLSLNMVPERQNTVNVLLFFDVGGSMDMHVRVCEELFSAARSAFRHMDFLHFHNCLYEFVWKDSRTRYTERIATMDVLRKYHRDTRVIFVGDATMSPYEILHPGGSVEHWNEEAGRVWMRRVLDAFPKTVWLNPQTHDRWHWHASIGLIREIMEDRMFPLTLSGLDRAMKCLA